MRIVAVVLVALLHVRCGGNAPLKLEPNQALVTVDPGALAPAQPYTNGLFVSATFCVPGTTTCHTVDNLLVDTGSVGVRVLESELPIALPSTSENPGTELLGCAPFFDANTWGPIRVADLQVGGETAASLTIQTIGDSTFPVAVGCQQGGPPANDLENLGCKGIFGIGVLREDCGDACAPGSPRNAGFYYECDRAGATGCAKTLVPNAKQVANPVTQFPVNNNGTLIRLPQVSPDGASSAAGVLTFGIGTQSNNSMGDAKIVALNGSGYTTTSFPLGGTKYESFIDSGSNAIFFMNSATTNLKQCRDSSALFYCDNGSFRAGITATDGTDLTVPFDVKNAADFSAKVVALNNLAGPMPGFPYTTHFAFDWGLPFYFGRTVFTSILPPNAAPDTTPFMAF